MAAAPAPPAAVKAGLLMKLKQRRSAPRPIPGDLAEPPADALQAEPQAGPLNAREDMLAYGSLRMPSPRSEERGSLVISLRSRLYMELFIEQHVELRVDIDRAIHGALRHAESAGQELPHRFRLAASDDGFDRAQQRWAEDGAHFSGGGRLDDRYQTTRQCSLRSFWPLC